MGFNLYEITRFVFQVPTTYVIESVDTACVGRFLVFWATKFQLMKQILIVLLVSLTLSLQGQEWPRELLTHPELTAYRETSSYEQVMSVVKAAIKDSPYAHLISMGQSKEGKDIPVVVMANPKVTSAEEAKATGKPIIYVQGNIHSGEVEGKEALQVLLREILKGERSYLLDNQILLFAPIYNTDSNDKMEQGRRPSQEDSPVKVGIRANSQGWDLNRDGMKAEALETQGLFQNIIVPWDPALFVDLHTTNGVWHGYSLTWAPSYHTAGEKAPFDYTWNKILPDVTDRVLKDYGIYLGPYGYFYTRSEGWPIKSIYTYNHHPRYLVNQFGLRNRMAILSEAFAHERLYQRMASTYAFVREILEYTHKHGREILEVNKTAEEASIRLVKEQAGKVKKGVRFEMVAMEEPIDEYRIYNHAKTTNAQGQEQYIRLPEIITLKNVENHSAFNATVTATLPRGYVIPKEMGHIAAHLRMLGAKVDTLTRNSRATGEVFTATGLELANRPFEGHNMATLEGSFSSQTRRFSKGDFYVDLAQPLANLIFYLMEPQSDDGLVTWNFFDAYFEKQNIAEKPVEYPIFKYFELK